MSTRRSRWWVASGAALGLATLALVLLGFELAGLVSAPSASKLANAAAEAATLVLLLKLHRLARARALAGAAENPPE